jgi:CMP/dCMP kinase
MHLNQNSYIQDPVTKTPKLSPFVVTIDGPAASGKTTVSRELARKLGFQWVSTGAFYRGLAFAATYLNYDLGDEAKIAELAQSDRWAVKMTPEETQVYFDGKDVTAMITREKVAAAASQISQYPLVRHELLPLQQACWDGKNGLVAEGRDCGTTVFPQAELKVYLTARSEDRAKRRADQRGEDVNTVKAEQIARDQRDTKRASSPLQVAEKSKVLDTSDMNLTEVVEKIFEWVDELNT